ncbi:polysaccharide deacetylase family protein [Amycolatopsis sp. DSM 110486]|uniref:polysaccharide deacetylase family protein n=1 Tax=Amycolatopsis sp. DSM 110486 TaxID=2865832 RepID=UPI001C6A52CF|nr:polysaccharide deacetylase family protein [Amycolatopsis sp. DSM 110486]QYN18729.1 polysaccharide deacetylase family protein [Amycolatopsis sp. DSM 110486]
MAESTRRERDFVGYGRHAPRVRWPGEEKLVVNIVVNYEEGSEYSVLDGDDHNDGWGEYDYEVDPAIRDFGSETHYEFGSRVGIWRLARLFDRFEVPVTIGACATALERNPEVAQWIRESPHDVVGHGYRWLEYNRVDREVEREHLRLAIASLERTTGERPLGWYLRSFPSENTLELLVEEGGFLYDSDACNDELPYFTDVSGQQVLMIPYSKVYNDTRYLLNPTYGSPAQFFESMRLGIDYLCDEIDHGLGPRMLTVGLHPRWSGQANRASAVRDLLEYVSEKKGVSFMRRLDIARWWLGHHHEWAGSR